MSDHFPASRAVAFDFCDAEAKKADYDRYLISRFFPHNLSVDVLPLIALNAEIAKTRQTVTETTIGLIRLQWWRDQINLIYQNPEQNEFRHDILNALAYVIRLYDLPQEDFDFLIYGREFDVEDRAPLDMAGLIHYCDITVTPFMRLLGKMLKIKDEENLRQIAIIYGLVGIMRSVVHKAKYRHCLLPQKLLEKSNINYSEIYDFSKISKLQQVIKLIHQECMTRISILKLKNRYLKLFTNLSNQYLGQIKKAHFDIASPSLMLPPFMREVRLYCAFYFQYQNERV
jgi:phytoene synthase